MKNHCYRPATQGFWNFTRLQSREIQANQWNPAKFGRNLTKYMSVQRIWDLSWLKGCFSHKLANLSWNFVTATRNVPKLPDVLRLLLRKTGHWPVHDIKSFASGMFLSSLLLKEQNYEDLWLKKNKKNLVRDDAKSKWDRKASGGFDHRIASFKKATFISSRYFCSCCYCTG